MKKAYFSNRIYKNVLNNKYVSSMKQTLFVFNQMKHFSFNTQVKEKRSGKSYRSDSMQITVKTKYGVNDYFANSAIQEAKALMSSQEELTKLYIKEKEEKCKTIKKKIKNTKSRITTLRKIKASIIKGKPKFNKTSREQKMGRFFVVQFKKQTDLYFDLYDFEHLYLDKEIKFLKSQLGKFSYRLNRIQKQINSLKSKTKSAVFGSKKLFKAQFTIDRYKNNHESWYNDFHQARYNQMTISGRKDAKYGNFVFQYDTEKNQLFFESMDGTIITIPSLVFPHGQEQVNDYFQTQINLKDKKKFGKPCGWAIEDHGDYYIFKCLIDVPSNEHLNYSKSTGVIGIDCNVDHFAISNINNSGQLVDSFVRKFEIVNKTSNQITKIIEAEVVSIIDYAVKHHKPIAIEKLDTTISKGKDIYGNKKANKLKSLFAYKKMIGTLKSRADKMGVAVFEVNPAYTSQIGKMKYMKRLGISIHQAAAYVIARRAFGYKETLPPVLDSLLPEKIVGLHQWVHWKYCMNLLNGIRTHAFYQSEFFDLTKFRAMCELFNPKALTDLEKMGLAKIKK